MSFLKKVAGNFLKKKAGEKLGGDPLEKVIELKKRLFMIKIIAGIVAFFLVIIVVIAVISFLLGFVQENAERLENLARGGCILCTNDELEQMKENQFNTKIRIIKQVGGPLIDAPVLASTVLFQGEYNDVIDSVYTENFDEGDFTDQVRSMISSLSVTGSDDYVGIDQSQINLIDAATIIMINSSVDGKYNEENYKKALVSSGYGSDNFVVNGASCAANTLLQAIKGAILTKIPLISFLGGGNAADAAISTLDSVSICEKGFIEGTFKGVAQIKDEHERKIKKEQIAENIILFANFYKSLFPDLEETTNAGAICSYKIKGIDDNVSNVKVQTVQCESGNKSGSVGDSTGESLIDFEDVYIPGVVYPEVGSSFQTEAQKAQAVAARSYALTRDNQYTGLSIENGQWVLKIRTCTSDQVFCNPDQGCESLTGSMQGTNSGGDTVYAGDANGDGSVLRPALSADSPIRSNVASTKGQVAVDSEGYVVNTPYVSNDQNAWNNSALEGNDYKNIILNHYSSKGVRNITSNCYGSGTGIYTTEQIAHYYELSTSHPKLSQNTVSEDMARTQYGSMEGFYNHIVENINNAGYHTRQGVVAAGVSLIGDYIEATGTRIRYNQNLGYCPGASSARLDPETAGLTENLYLDCSGFTWWALYNAGFKLPSYAQTSDIYNWATNAGYASNVVTGGQPGDFLVTKGKGHVMMIIGTYDKGYYVAEEGGCSVGGVITMRAYSRLSGNYVLINMDDYYSNSENYR